MLAARLLVPKLQLGNEKLQLDNQLTSSNWLLAGQVADLLIHRLTNFHINSLSTTPHKQVSSRHPPQASGGAPWDSQNLDSRRKPAGMMFRDHGHCIYCGAVLRPLG